MAPKPLTQKEQEVVQKQLDNAYWNKYIVPIDRTVHDHIDSYDTSQNDAKLNFNSYMQKFLSLNRDLRTDQEGITELMDNVPSVFSIPEKGGQLYFYFNVNQDFNSKGTIKIFFESRQSVRVFVSDSMKKP